ncbi:UNVERIFIED_CONTAM: hypothetical protein FKN15_045888 [Acipenser sinensis]
MNLAKTKWMRNLQAANNNIHIGQKEIEQVDSYVYLGQELTAGHKNSRELARRRRAAWVSYASIAEVVTNTADATLRAHQFNSTVLPAMLYGAETWSLTAADRQKLAVTERALERRMVGVKRTDHISNELLRKTSKVKDAVNQADQAKKHWAGHVARRSDGRWTRAVTEWLPLDIKRLLGRPATRLAGLAQTRHRQRLEYNGLPYIKNLCCFVVWLVPLFTPVIS